MTKEMNLTPSSTVGALISEWYTFIKKFNVISAQLIKEEIEHELETMEEDQDVLVYYQLMNFRHSLMLDYLFPTKSHKLEVKDKAKYLREREGKRGKLEGLLDYYYYFFKGMYEFDEGEYIKAIKFYKKSEKKLMSKVFDDIERAEFNYKMSEVFYNIKHPHMSMYYALLAHDTYRTHETYIVRKIQCHFVIAGNCADLATHEKALPHLEKALQNAEEIKNKSLKAKAFINLGQCYNQMNDPSTAIMFFRKAILASEEANIREVTNAYYELSLIHLKQGEKIEGVEFFKKGIESAERFKDVFYLSLFNVVLALFIESGNKNDVVEAFKPLRTSKGYPYLEELALDAAGFYTKRGNMEDAVYFFSEMVNIQKQIRKGDFQYET